MHQLIKDRKDQNSNFFLNFHYCLWIKYNVEKQNKIKNAAKNQFLQCIHNKNIWLSFQPVCILNDLHFKEQQMSSWNQEFLILILFVQVKKKKKETVFL